MTMAEGVLISDVQAQPGPKAPAKAQALAFCTEHIVCMYNSEDMTNLNWYLSQQSESHPSSNSRSLQSLAVSDPSLSPLPLSLYLELLLTSTSRIEKGPGS